MIHPIRLAVVIVDLGIIGFAGWLWFFRPHEQGTLALCLALVAFALVGLLPLIISLRRARAEREMRRRDTN